MKKLSLVVLLLLLALTLAACKGDDKKEDTDTKDTNDSSSGGSSSGGDVAASGEKALNALLTGSGDEFLAEFCDEMKDQLTPFATALEQSTAAFAQAGTTPEFNVTCEMDGDKVKCGYAMTVGGVESPGANYSIAVKDGKLCGIPEAAVN